MLKIGDVVRYSAYGQTHNAIVLHAHSGQVDHLGANGEPLLHLAFVAPERESEIVKRRMGYIPQLFTEFDVVHHSHEFSEAYKKDHGLTTPAQIASARGAGEWEELPDTSDEAFATVLKDNADVRNQLRDAQTEIERLKTANPPAPPAQPQAADPLDASVATGDWEVVKGAPAAPPLHEVPQNEPEPEVPSDSDPQEN